MQIEIKGISEHKGFLLKSPLELNGRLFVFSGQNGSGKTRFFESMQTGGSKVEIDGATINSREIHFIAFDKLSPSLEGEFNKDHFNRTREATIKLFNHVKNDIEGEIQPRHAASLADQFQGSLPYYQLRQICQEISSKTKKPISTLSSEEIKLHFDGMSSFEFGVHNLTDTINKYIIRKRDNLFNEFLSRKENKKITFYSEEEFSETFGPEPWVAFNSILKTIFDGDLKISAPEDEEDPDSYRVKLYKNNQLLPLNSHSLSTGERTLLWLTLTLFNMEFQAKNRLSTQTLLLIDEPDAYLHPQITIKLHKTFEALTERFNMAIFFTTHSPTTIALHPNDNIYIIDKNHAKKSDKDQIISELLGGITQISISPENRRQIFTESQYDADVYQAIFPRVAHASKIIDPKISLHFISSGPKVPDQQLIDKCKQILRITDTELLSEFVKSVNGIGSCAQVIAQVDSITQNGNQFVRGIIDWDKKNNPTSKIAVFAKKYAYSIENVALDPICILLLLHTQHPDKFKMVDICNADTTWQQWLANDGLLQASLDIFISKVIGRENRKDRPLEYLSEITLQTDSEYLEMNGHDLEEKIKYAYPKLNSFCKKNKDGELKFAIVSRPMITLSNGKLIPKAFEEIFHTVQK